jgi:hypothetical protein
VRFSSGELAFFVLSSEEVIQMQIAAPKLSQDAAIELAFEVERTEAVLKQLKRRLKEYVDVNGPLITREKVWGYCVSVTWSFEPDQLKQMAVLIGIEGRNPWELLGLSAAALKKLGWNETILAQFGLRKESKKFDSRKR